jgi:hypothetical protein
MSSDNIATSAVGEMLNNTRIGIGNNKYGKCGSETKKKSKVSMGTDGTESFFRSIGRRGETISSEPYPGEDRNESKLMKYFRIVNITGSSENSIFNFCG